MKIEMLMFLTLPVLFVSSVIDIKTKELPIRGMAAYCAVLKVVSIFLQPNFIFLSQILIPTICAVYTFLMYFMLAKHFGGGGGDCIYMTCLAFLYGIAILPIILITSFCFLGYSLFQRRNGEKEVAYIPCVTAGVLLQMSLCFIEGGYL
ncbi:MAG: prepilin peptidase [Anaerostipes caccae]